MCGCLTRNPEGWGRFKIPAPTAFNKFPYGKDRDWQQGFADGCQSYYSIVGVGAARLLPVKIDGWKMTGKNPLTGKSPHPEIKDANLYMTGFEDGMEDCTYAIDWNII